MIKKELSICQSLMCLDLVSFPVLSQIKPQAPYLRRPCTGDNGLYLKPRRLGALIHPRQVSEPSPCAEACRSLAADYPSRRGALFLNQGG